MEVKELFKYCRENNIELSIGCVKTPSIYRITMRRKNHCIKSCITALDLYCNFDEALKYELSRMLYEINSEKEEGEVIVCEE